MDIGILDSLLISGIALEADDITKEVNNILGGKNSPAEKTTDAQREEDLTQTDNIFDDINKDESENNPQDNPTETNTNNSEDADNNDSNEEPVNADSLNDELGESEDNTTEDDMPQDDPESNEPMDGSNDENQSSVEKSIFSDKNTLNKNMIYFFNIIRSTINSLENEIGLCDDQETIRVINSVTQNLYAAKNVLYKLITKEISKLPYETLVTKYVTIKRIYDISCDMIEEYFKENRNKKKIKFKRFKNKTK